MSSSIIGKGMFFISTDNLLKKFSERLSSGKKYPEDNLLVAEIYPEDNLLVAGRKSYPRKITCSRLCVRVGVFASASSRLCVRVYVFKFKFASVCLRRCVCVSVFASVCSAHSQLYCACYQQPSLRTRGCGRRVRGKIRSCRSVGSGCSTVPVANTRSANGRKESNDSPGWETAEYFQYKTQDKLCNTRRRAKSSLTFHRPNIYRIFPQMYLESAIPGAHSLIRRQCFV